MWSGMQRVLIQQSTIARQKPDSLIRSTNRVSWLASIHDTFIKAFYAEVFFMLLWRQFTSLYILLIFLLCFTAVCLWTSWGLLNGMLLCIGQWLNRLQFIKGPDRPRTGVGGTEMAQFPGRCAGEKKTQTLLNFLTRTKLTNWKSKWA